MITTDQIVAAIKAKPEVVTNIAVSWPAILAALTIAGMPTESTQIAAIATVAVESPTFLPMTEKYNGDPAVYFARYDGRLGNDEPGDGQRFCGRGFIQITGRANYAKYGQILGVDLVNDPTLALHPDIAAKILANYFHDHKIDAYAADGDWVKVRKLVNGGTNGLDLFLTCVNALKGSSNG